MEPIEIINKRLLTHYGRGDNGEPRLRVVYSDDQFEKQLTKYTAEGLELPYKIVREVPKYRQWIQHKYILEQLTAVPESTGDAIAAGQKLSYEVLWVFQDPQGNALPPKWEVIEIVMDSVRKALSEADRTAKYPMPEKDYNTTEALLEKEKNMMEVLFGNETDLGVSLAHGNAVGYGTSQKFDIGKKMN